jgi:hypothetical protein
MLMAAVFGMIAVILYNWGVYCPLFYPENEKCHGKPSSTWVANTRIFNNICSALTSACYYNGHFLFAFRYFEVTEMFGREDKSLAKHERNRGITRKISYVGVAIITINYLVNIVNYGIYRRVTNEYNETLHKWISNIVPGVLLMIDCILLCVALVWICHSLRYDPQVMGNEKWMAVHSGILVLMLGSYIWTIFFAQGYAASKIY